MNYAIVTLFGFISGIFLTFKVLSWMLTVSPDSRRPIIKLIHDKYAHEFYDYCASTCGSKQSVILDLINQIEREPNAQEDSKQSQVVREEGSSASPQSGSSRKEGV